MVALKKVLKRSFTLFELLIVVAILAIIFAIAVPSVLTARKHANEAMAITSLRGINGAEAIYLTKSPGLIYGNIGQLNSASLLDEALGSGTKSGYTFSVFTGNDIVDSAAGTPNPANYFYSKAIPITGGSTGDRYFFSDQSGAIRFCSLNLTVPDTAIATKTLAVTGR